MSGTSGDFIGVPAPLLSQWLLEAQTALQQLSTGGKAVTLAYSQGDGSKSVTYSAATVSNLRAHIIALQAALGVPNTRRRPMRPIFV